MKILFIQTGGTIDKDYPHLTKGWAFEIDTPAVKRILEKLAPSFDFQILSACKKDSMELLDEDRQIIVDLIQEHQADGYIVTHGTDTMIETAQFIAARIENKHVVITGAMRPERFTNSDAAINLGLAIGAVQGVNKGVYIAMHGIVKLYDKIARDTTTGKYY